mmetsp:Transcript_142356/g.370839  ORF Transcript_142356/g.370839 Transcript_142356/m.370839 type:complete len:225 (+) Transcript_142356:212-886(+)
MVLLATAKLAPRAASGPSRPTSRLAGDLKASCALSRPALADTPSGSSAGSKSTSTTEEPSVSGLAPRSMTRPGATPAASARARTKCAARVEPRVRCDQAAKVTPRRSSKERASRSALSCSTGPMQDAALKVPRSQRRSPVFEYPSWHCSGQTPPLSMSLHSSGFSSEYCTGSACAHLASRHRGSENSPISQSKPPTGSKPGWHRKPPQLRPTGVSMHSKIDFSA